MTWNWLANLPTQQAMAALVILLWLPTGICSLTGCTINENWYGTLLTLTFATVLHYGIKRWTFKPGQQDVEKDGTTT